MNEDNTKNHQRSFLEQAPSTQLLLERYKCYTMYKLLDSLDLKLTLLETINSLNVLKIWRADFNANINVLNEMAIAAFYEKYSSLQAAANSPSVHSQNLDQSRESKKASGLRISEIIDLTLDSDEGCLDIGVGNASEKSSNSVDYSIPHGVAQSTTIITPPQSIQRSEHSSINQYMGEKPVLDGSGSTDPGLDLQYAETQMQTANSTLRTPFDTQPLYSAPEEISLQTISGSETVPSSTAARRRGDPHRCNVCSKTLTRGTTLREHARSHTNERPYKCSICEKNFSRHKDCRRHELLHANAKEFHCGGRLNRHDQLGFGCGRGFTRMDALKAHWKSLSGADCLKALFERAKEINHDFLEQRHFDDTRCVCDNKFESIDDLEIHFEVPLQSSCLRQTVIETGLIFARGGFGDVALTLIRNRKHQRRTK
ncbi:hypothetical protein BTUL_0096g00080 [Botrytis tulipae]|uniref:C2H2-type domain-containing protein n=1 Tax=Botrytis tulipae TaxID=87230 RepID=A0A4Z1ES71_9HELO|nr:hypothetical protein BTUL_0096g00080 [Botrytis tulipae]